MKKKDVIFSVVLLLVAFLMFFAVRFTITGNVTIGALPTTGGDQIDVVILAEDSCIKDHDCYSDSGCPVGYYCDIEQISCCPIPDDGGEGLLFSSCDTKDDCISGFCGTQITGFNYNYCTDVCNEGIACQAGSYCSSTIGSDQPGYFRTSSGGGYCIQGGCTSNSSCVITHGSQYYCNLETTICEKIISNDCSFVPCNTDEFLNESSCECVLKFDENHICTNNTQCKSGDCNSSGVCGKSYDGGLAGSGPTGSSVIYIDSCEDLRNIKDDLKGNYVMAGDINCINKDTWFPIPGKFIGSLDGDIYDIGNLTINVEKKQFAGLFEENEGILRNIDIVNASLIHIGDPNNYIAGGGILVGKNNGVIENCHVYSSNLSAGLKLNFLQNESNFDYGFGGIVGYNAADANITSCSAEIISFSKNKDTGYANKFGGLIGFNEGIINESNSIIDNITGNKYIGGLVGYNKGSIYNSYSEIINEIRGNIDVGGLVGFSGNFCKGILNCYSAGLTKNAVISGKTNVGGLAGILSTSESYQNLYSSKLKIIGEKDVGGLVGYLISNLNNSFSSENQIEFGSSNTNHYGGDLIGNLVGDSTIENSYYYTKEYIGCVGGLENTKDTDTCKKVNSKNLFYNNDSFPLSEWDFTTIWKEERNGYPTLRKNYESDDCIWISNNLAVNPEEDRKCVSTPNKCVYDIKEYDIGEKLIHEGLVKICSSNLNWINYSLVGEGNLDSPYQIKEFWDLQAIENDLDGYYILKNNITIKDNEKFIPISSFTGLLDGDGHTISGLFIEFKTEDNVGLFKEIKMESGSATKVKDINFEDAFISGNNNVGGLAGNSSVSSQVPNYIKNVHFFNSYIEGGNQVGGLIGKADDTKIIDSSFEGRINATTNNIGGLIGELTSTSELLESYSEIDSIIANSVIGGLVGKNSGTINKSYSEIVSYIKGTSISVGGLVGENCGQIDNSYSKGSGLVTGKDKTGAFVGLNSKSIKNSYVIDLEVECLSNGYVGGFVGRNIKGIITNSFVSNVFMDTDNVNINKRGTFAGEVDGGSCSGNRVYNSQEFSDYTFVGKGFASVTGALFASDFYSTSNDPLNNWDHSIWKFYTSTYPKLRAFPLKDCIEDEDCPGEYCGGNQVCESRIANFEEECSRDEMCESGLCGSSIEKLENYNYCLPKYENGCLEGYFEPEFQICVECLDDAENSTHYCVNNRWVSGCTTNTAEEDCNSNQFCKSGRCTTKNAVGDSCNADDWCISGICKDDDSDGRGECVYCNSTDLGLCSSDGSQYCYNNGCTDYQQLLDDCIYDSSFILGEESKQCNESLICSGKNYCTYMYDWINSITYMYDWINSITSNSPLEGSCPNNFVIFGTFPYSFICAECNSTENTCASNQVCSSDGRCVDQCNVLGESEICGNDKYCNGTQCVNKKGSVGAKCDENYMCGNGLFCFDLVGDNFCAECTHNDNCSSNEFCSEFECVDKLGGGESCSDKSQCKSNRCTLGKCIECTSFGGCESDEFCENNECVLKGSFSTSCSNDNQCDESDGLTCNEGDLGYCTYEGSESDCSAKGLIYNENVGSCVECMFNPDCSNGEFCTSNFLCRDNVYLENAISFYQNVPSTGITWNNNQLIYNISDSSITINEVKGSDFTYSLESTTKNLFINLSVKDGYLYNKNSTVSRYDNALVLKPTNPLQLNVSYGSYNTVLEIPVNFTLRCDTEGMTYNFTYLDNNSQTLKTFYCYDGNLCKAGEPCAIITSPSGIKQTYLQNISLDFLKYVNEASFNYSWFSDRLGINTVKKNVSEASALEIPLNILGRINITLNISKGLDSEQDEISFISSTENPACYIDENNKAYWVYNDSLDLIKYDNGPTGEASTGASCYFGTNSNKIYGTCCPKDYKCNVPPTASSQGTCEFKNTGFTAAAESTLSTCQQITAAENCRLAEWDDSSFNHADLPNINCSNIENITLNGVNQTVYYDCYCSWNVSLGECQTNYTLDILKYCLTDSDCSAGQECNGTLCLDIEDYCTHDDNCSRGRLCNDSIDLCYEPAGYCDRNSDCSGGKICNDSYRCDYCSNDSDCSSGYFCSTSGTNNYCIVIPSDSNNNNNNNPDPTYNNYNNRNTGTTNTGGNSNNSSNSDGMKWLWIIPTVIFFGVIVLIIFILKKHHVKKNKFDDDYKKPSKLPPTPPTAPFGQFASQAQGLVRSPPRKPMNQQFPPRLPPTNLPPQRPQGVWGMNPKEPEKK